MSKERIYVLGAGGHAREIEEYIYTLYGSIYCPDRTGIPHERSVRHRKVFFVVPDGEVEKTVSAAREEHKKQIISMYQYYEEMRKHPGSYTSIMGAGFDSNVRRRMNEEIREPFLTLVHPLAHISDSASVAPGAVICPFASVASYARIGEHALRMADE